MKPLEEWKEVSRYGCKQSFSEPEVSSTGNNPENGRGVPGNVKASVSEDSNQQGGEMVSGRLRTAGLDSCLHLESQFISATC